MSEEIVVAEKQQGLAPMSHNDLWSMAQTLAKSSLVPDDYKNKPENIYLAVTYGMEIGFGPATALMNIIVVRGRTSMYANSMAALVHASGKAVYFQCIESSATSATYETLRVGKGYKPRRLTFTMEDAKRAGLDKPSKSGVPSMYQKYPARMLENRAKAALAKDVYQDVIAGISCYEEIIDIEETPSAAFAAPEPEQPENVVNFADAILACKTQAELDALAPDLAKLGKKDKELAKEIWRRQQATIEAADA